MESRPRHSTLTRRTVLAGLQLTLVAPPAFGLGVSEVDCIYVDNYATISDARPLPMAFKRGRPNDVPPLNGSFDWLDHGHWSFIVSPCLFDRLFAILYRAPLCPEPVILKWAATQSPKMIFYAAFAKGGIRFGDAVVTNEQFNSLSKELQNAQHPIPGYLSCQGQKNHEG